MNTLETKAIALLKNCSKVTLSSNSEEGYPRPCIISKIDNTGIKEIIFSTGTNSRKTKNFRIDNKAGIAFFYKGDSVTLLGEVEIVTNKEEKDAYWQDWFINHFPKGKDDPEYTILRFKAFEATIWIDNEFATIKI